MEAVRSDFRKRVGEVNRYFRFVSHAAMGNVNLDFDQNGAAIIPALGHDELVKTLKATCYLVLYNLIEATMRGLVQRIFDEFRANGTRFDDCRSEIRRIILFNLRQRNPDKIMARLLDVARDMVTETFDAREEFLGTLDARAIRKTAARYGFDPPTEKTGWALYEVKNNRNDLAHGNKSFSDVGRDTTPDKLEQARKQTVVILFLTLRSVARYLQEQRYLSAHTAA